MKYVLFRIKGMYFVHVSLLCVTYEFHYEIG